MAVFKVPCPKCNAVLKSAVALPEGATVKCPQCKSSFRVQQQGAVRANVATAHAPRSHAPTPLISIPAMAPAAGPNRGLRVALVLIGLLMFLGTGAALLVWILKEPANSLAQGEAKNQTANSPTNGEAKNATPNIPGNQAQLPADIPPPKIKAAAINRPLIQLTAEEDKTIDAMIFRGVKYLKLQQRPDGAWGPDEQPEWKENLVGFCGLTLLECGVKADDPVIQRAAQFARDLCPRVERTYVIAMLVLFLDRLNDPQDKERIEELAMRLVAGQTMQGGWDYKVPLLPTTVAKELSNFLRASGRRSSKERLQSAPKSLPRLGLLETPANPDPGFFVQGQDDNSNTQFALLALWAARKHKVPVDQSLDLVVRRFRNSQKADGSYGYKGGNLAIVQFPDGKKEPMKLPSMTCAGLLGLALSYGMADKIEGGGPQNDVMIKNGLEHLKNFIGEPAPNAQANIAMTDMYFLWSIERVAVLFQLPKILEKDWFRWGFTILRKNQDPQGFWLANQGVGRGQIPDTCFALLFLKRVNLVKDLTDKINELYAAQAAGNYNNVPRKDN
jgi:hypothetical protein